MQKPNILEPLISDEETVLHRHKTPDRTLVWKRSLAADIQEDVSRLIRGRQHRGFMGALNDVWLKAELSNGNILLRKNCWRAPNTWWWQKKITFSQLFASQNASPLVRDIEVRLRDAFECFSATQLNVRFFTRLAKYRLIKPHQFHTDVVYVMVLSYAAPCAELTCAPSMHPVVELPEGSVSIMPPGQVHRSPSYREGGTSLCVTIF